MVDNRTLAFESSALTSTRRGIDQTLRHEARFRLVVEASPSAMVMIRTATGRIEMVNAQAERLFGYPRDELQGQPMDMLVPKRFRGLHPALRGGFFGDPRTLPLGSGPDLYGLRKDGTEVPVEIGLNPIETNEGPMVLYAIVDISLRKRTAERFRLVVEASPSAMVMIHATGIIEMVNTQTERLFGYPREELLGRSIEILIPERLFGRDLALRRGFFGNPRPRPLGAGLELFGLRKDGTEFPVEIGLNPIETEDGPMVLYAVVDISERFTAARALAQSEAEFRASFEAAAVGKMLADPQTKCILRANHAFARMLGYQPEDLIGQPWHQYIWHEDLDVDTLGHVGYVSGEEAAVKELRYIRRDGSPFWTRASATTALVSGSQDKAIIVSTIEDIDIQYRAEAALRVAKQELEYVVEERTSALKQRDLLLREVYHRVKNNLQLVDSLLVIQARRLEDKQAAQGILSLRGRIFALGLVHQQLMGSKNLNTFDLALFLNDLFDNVVDRGTNNDVTVSVKACILKATLDFAVPLGLLVNELVGNALIHDYPNKSGNVHVILHNETNGNLTLTVSSNGVDPTNAETSDKCNINVGNCIITSLVSQLEGTMQVQLENGMKTEIRMAMPVVA